MTTAMSKRTDGGYYPIIRNGVAEVFVAPKHTGKTISMGFRLCVIDEWVADRAEAALKLADALNAQEGLPLCGTFGQIAKDRKLLSDIAGLFADDAPLPLDDARIAELHEKIVSITTEYVAP
jgi:hypothetical protein